MNRLAMVAALLTSLAFAAPVAAQVRYVQYVVKEGDTCSSIATEAYGDATAYDLIHRANDLGEPPHDLQAGQVLRLPRVAAALLARERGKVMVKSPETDWANGTAGIELFRSWRVNTLEEARALLAFRDESELTMRENTLVVIYDGSAKGAVKKRTRARLESGALRSRLAELSGLTVETPTGEADLGEGASLVTIDEEQTARFANHGGEEMIVRATAGGEVKVAEGFGSKVAKKARPTPPRPLPPSPAWRTSPDSFPTFGVGTVVTGWEAVPGASGYFVELTADELGVQVIEAAYVGADVTNLEVANLPPGTYYATVSTIDDDFFESIPSERRELRVVGFDFDRRYRIAEDPPRFLAGATLTAPAGLKCGADGDEPGESFVLMPKREVPPARSGFVAGWVEKAAVDCTNVSGATTTIPVEVQVPSFVIEGTTFAEGRVAVPRGAATELRLTFEEAAVPLDASGRGLDVEIVRVGPKELRARVRHVGDESDDRPLEFAVGGRVLATVDVSVEEAVTPVAPVRRLLVELGAAMWLQGRGTGLGDPPERELAEPGLDDDVVIRGVSAVGMRMTGALLADGWFKSGLVLDAGVAPTHSGDTVGVLGFGLGATVTAPFSVVRPWLGLEFEVWTPAFRQVVPTGSGLAGLDVELGFGHGLRLAGRAMLMDGDGHPAFGGGVMLGYYVSLGTNSSPARAGTTPE